MCTAFIVATAAATVVVTAFITVLSKAAAFDAAAFVPAVFVVAVFVAAVALIAASTTPTPTNLPQQLW